MHLMRGNNGGSGQGGATHENRGSISGIRVSLFPSKDHSEGYGMTVSMVDVPLFHGTNQGGCRTRAETYFDFLNTL